MWLHVFEAWLTARLLGSPTFHRGVRHLAKKVSEIRHGKDPSEMGGTKIDNPDAPDLKRFMTYFREELRNQLPGGKPKK